MDGVEAKTVAPTRPGMDTPSEALLARVRDQNIFALAQRHALALVHGPAGYLARINPGSPDHPQGFPVLWENATVHPIEQRYVLLGAIAELLLLEVDEKTIAARVEAARPSTAEEPCSRARASRAFVEIVSWAQDEATRRRQMWQAMAAPVFGPEAAVWLVDRLGRIRWLERTIGIVARFRFDADLRSLCQKTLAVAHKALDNRYVWTTRCAHRTECPSGAGRIQQESALPTPARRSSHRLPADHDNYRHLATLEDRLERGEISAIGGADYAKQRFPRAILDAAAAGNVQVVVFDGELEAARAYVIDHYGQDAGQSMRYTELGLEGIDGSGPRRFFRFENGRRVLLVVGRGESRQLHLAGGLLLYHTEAKTHISLENIELACDGQDLIAAMRSDLQKAFKSDAFRSHDLRVRGARVSDKTRTRLLIVQNPEHITHAFAGLQWTTISSDGVVPFRIGYGRTKRGQLVRLLVPKVGGNGLYGDTAGCFVEAVFTAKVKNLSSHIVFNGTAGGFSGTASDFSKRDLRGLGQVAPGGLLTPIGTVRQHGEADRPIPSLLKKSSLQENLVNLGVEVHFTDHHIAVKAPAIETFDLIDNFVQEGFASVDVEGGAIVSAIERLGRADITFTPIYTHSDDPRESRHVRWDSLALMGPFFEGSRPNPELWALVGALLHVVEDESVELTNAAAVLGLAPVETSPTLVADPDETEPLSDETEPLRERRRRKEEALPLSARSTAPHIPSSIPQ